ncbi:MAG: trypsin-like peptidase domain-containing protein [Anaerolineales bacterium]|jgi:S1-C subfamily serine protease
MKQKFKIKNNNWLKLLLALSVVLAVTLACGSFVQFNPTQSGSVVEATAIKVTPTFDTAQETIPTFTPRPAQAQPAGAPDGLQSLVQKYEQLNPGVVNIKVVVQRGGQTGEAAGSGFIIDNQGHIVTNNHVVEGAVEVVVVYYDGFEVQADIVGTDADSDLAVLHVNQLTDGAHLLELGNSDNVQVGEWVIAIGNPFGLGSSMTTGIVSAVGRTIQSGVTPFSIPQAIQTDAAINPGNSGGPLIDLNGSVIGVNAQIATGGTQANAGVGFAIPVNVVRRVAPVLIAQGVYQWPYLGIEGGSIGLLLQQAQNLPTQRGAIIGAVTPGGPADQAGIQPGDIIVEANGKPVNNIDDLLVQIASSEPGDKLNLTILRNGQRQQVTATLIARP